MKVLLLENDAASAGVVRDLLQASGHTVNWCRRLGDVIRLPEQAHDVLLVALRLPDGSGLDWAADLRRNGFTTPVLLLTERCQPVELRRASDPCAEPCAVRDNVLSTIRAALCQAHAFDHSLRTYGHVELDPSARRASVRGACVRLTDREWDVLVVLTQSAGSLVSKSDLESKAIGAASPVNSNAIEVHVSSLRRKLGRTFIETVRGRGYRISG
jgi:two-component system OmpR family response regulator